MLRRLLCGWKISLVLSQSWNARKEIHIPHTHCMCNVYDITRGNFFFLIELLPPSPSADATLHSFTKNNCPLDIVLATTCKSNWAFCHVSGFSETHRNETVLEDFQSYFSSYLRCKVVLSSVQKYRQETLAWQAGKKSTKANEV